MDDSEDHAHRSMRGRTILIASGYVAAAAALAWTAWLAGGASLLTQVRDLRWSFVAAAVIADLGAYLCQALRWKLLLRGVGDISCLSAAEAVYVGLFTSEVLPMRPGDGVRAWLVSRRLHAPVAAIVPSIIVERFFDAVLLSLSVGVVAIAVPLPPGFVAASRVLGVAVLAAAVALAAAALRRRNGVDIVNNNARRPSRVRVVLVEISNGIRTIGLARSTVAAFAFSCALLAGQMLAFWLAMRADKIEQPLLVGAAVLTLVRLATVVPNTPANAGTFQVFTIVGLAVFGVERERAAAFSIVSFVILTVPLWLLGGIAVARTGRSFAFLRQVYTLK